MGNAHAYLNDASELAYAHELLNRIVQNWIVREESGAARSFLERITHDADPFGVASEFYVSCFCQEGDLLSQWRGYGGRGAGCSIGFAPEDINGGSGPVVVLGDKAYALQGVLRQVEYNPAIQVECIEGLLSMTLDLLKQLAAGVGTGNVESLVSHAVGFARQHLIDFYLIFKNPAFEEEREWRAIFPFNRHSYEEANAFLRFRSSPDRLVPYIPVRLGLKGGEHQGKFPIRTVVLGPGLASLLGLASVRRFLVNCGYSHVEIVNSRVPLR